jgi:alkyl sulfatase BDS1-like metallo-beta-lactamase superfamily hydrolase
MSEKNLYENEDPIWRTHMQMLMKKKRNLEIAQTIDESLYEWYSERGKDVPKWKRKDPEWWTEYLHSLGIDPRNP